MSSIVNTRRTMIALAIVVAFVAVVVPTCRMVGCSMSVGSTMPWGHQSVPGLFGDCGGDYIVNGAPTAIVPSGADALTFAMVSAIVAALALLAPRLSTRPVVATFATPPPPPEEPRGMRFRL